jgi:tetratricopeptide (TPR) repeat protein
MTYLAECYEKTNNFTLAKKYYHEAIDLSPEYADPWLGLGIIALNAGKAEESLIYLRKAIRLDDQNPEIWYLFGKAHYLKYDKKVALRCFREALKIDPFYNEVWTDLANIIFSDGFISKALPYLEQAYKITGDVPGINYIMASFYLHSGNRNMAFVHLSNAIQMDSQLFSEFAEFFPGKLLNKKMIQLLEKNKLI